MARGNLSSASSHWTSNTIPVFPLTVSGWAKVSTTTQLFGVDDTGGSLDGLAVLYASSSGLQVFEFNGGTGGGLAIATSDPGTGAWFHFCGVFASASDRRAYVNGGNKDTDTSTPGADASLFDQLIVGGRTLGSPQYTNGDLADVGIWDVALTDAEIAVLGKGFACPHVRPGSLINYLPMVRGSQDLVGDLTETGTAGVLDHPPIIGTIAA